MLFAKIFRLFTLAFILSLSIAAQNFSEIHSKIRLLLENRDYAGTVTELQNLERADKKTFTLNNYDYLLARMVEKQGDYGLAAANYEAVVKRNSVLTEYALWHLAQIARSSGNLMLERIYLRQLLTTAPESLIRKAASARLMRSNFESKDFNSVISGQGLTATNINQSAPKNEQQSVNTTPTAKTESRETLVYIGQTYLQLGKTNEARDIFTKLVTGSPNAIQPDDFALAGARGLDQIEGGRENFGKAAPKLTDAEHYQRARIYQFNRDFQFARLHFAAIVQNHPQSAFAPDAMYQIGRGYAQENDYEKAINWFERVQAEFATQPIARDALSQAASAYSRVNKPREAVTRYQRFIEKYPDAENLDRAYLNIVDVHRDAGEDSEALRWAQKTREVFRGRLPEALALFAQARIHMAQNDWTSVLSDLTELQNFPDLGGTRVPGGTNQTELMFLKGFALENLKRYPEAIDVYLSIPDGRNEYYGWRATERLRALAAAEPSSGLISQKLNELRGVTAAQPLTAANAENIRRTAQSALRLTGDETVRNLLLETVRKAYSFLPNYQKIPGGKLLELGRREVLQEKRPSETTYHQTLADELLFLGLYDEGTPELETALRTSAAKSGQPSDYAYTLAVYFTRGEMANRGVVFVEPLWKNVPADYQIELIPREQIELLYPVPYVDSLLQHSTARSLDPRFALSIMRQESRFQADVKSNAAARGLMQFISTTSDKIAAEIGQNDFKQDDLYHPPTAVLFGSQYLANLFRQFPNQPQAVAASYNGGETNMARWMTRAKSDLPDRYVPEILFTQSKDYVYKVLANYRVYQTFYDEKLKAK